MTRNFVLGVIAAVGMLALSGCYRSPDINLHSPGAYKGPTDPLLKLEANPQQQQKLQQRFDLVQRDR